MPIRTLATRYPRLGKISCGYQDAKESKKKKGELVTFPRRTETLVFHSDDPSRLDVLAEAYGGTVKDHPVDEGRFFLVSETTEIAVHIPPAKDLEKIQHQYLEAWTAGGLLRRCDGEECIAWRMPAKENERPEISHEARECICDAEGLEDDERCKPVIRLAVILADLWQDMKGIGVWTVTSAGWSSNTELAGDLELYLGMLEKVGGSARFRLKVDMVPSSHGPVPKLSLDLDHTPREAAALAGTAPTLDAPAIDAAELEEPVGTYVDQPSLGNGAEDAAPPAAPMDDEEAGAEEPREDPAESSSSAPAPVVIGPIEVTPLPEDEIPEPSKDKPTQQAWSALRRIADDLGLTEGGARKAFEIRYDGDLSKADKDTLADFGKWLREQEQKRRARA